MNNELTLWDRFTKFYPDNKDYFNKDILVQILNYINDEMKGYLPEISSPSMHKKVEKLVKKDQKRINKVLSLSK